MAELAGLIVSGIGLVVLASTITDSLEQVHSARSHGTDFDHYALQLDLARLAYRRWLQSVKICEPGSQPCESPNLPVATEDETRIVRQLLGGIENAFSDAKRKGERYERSAPSTGSGSAYGTGADSSNELTVLGERVRAASKRRQKSVKLLDKVRWVIHDAKVMQTLSERVANNVKSLVELFPAATQSAQERLAAADIAEIVPAQDERSLSLSQEAAGNAPMQHMAAEAIKRSHTYENARLIGQARGMYGDQVAAGTQVTGYGHSYKDVSASDTAKALYGNQYGTSNFWDD